jgi:hypothetical protein
MNPKMVSVYIDYSDGRFWMGESLDSETVNIPEETWKHWRQHCESDADWQNFLRKLRNELYKRENKEQGAANELGSRKEG